MTTQIKIWPTQLIAKAELHEDPDNSNKQDRSTFKSLKDNIKEHGFDEPLIVKPREEGGYLIVSGNHRFKAGSAVGMIEFPCIVRDDWDEIESAVQGVRRNYGRGKIDHHAFTAAMDKISQEHSVPLTALSERIGFDDADKFGEYYKKEQEKDKRLNKLRMEAENRQVSASKVKIIDNLGLVVQGLIEQYGDTIPHSYIVFPAGTKNHMYIQVTPTLKRTLEFCAEKSVRDGMDINTLIGGLLAIGIHHAKFKKPDADIKGIEEAGSEEGDSDL